MKIRIQSVSVDGLERYLHDAVFGSVDIHPVVKNNLKDTPESILRMIDLDMTENVETTHRAIRIASIYHLHQQLLQTFIETIEEGKYEQITPPNPFYRIGRNKKKVVKEPEQLIKLLNRMKSCVPAGIAFKGESLWQKCGKIAVCPWCRYRKALDIMNALESRRSEARKIAVIKLSQPVAFDWQGHNLVLAGYKQLVDSLIHGIRKTTGVILCDAITTSPNWNRFTGVVHGDVSVQKPVFVLETTIAALLKKDEPLPLPENVMSKKARLDLLLCGGGQWNIMEPTEESLSYAMRSAFSFSPALLFTGFLPKDQKDTQPTEASRQLVNTYLNEYAESIDLQSRQRTVIHGFR